jgi:aspartyl-tRNA(Asn)/glutamyl-tRNA(Gln) amidotransferase subunit A
VMWPAHLSRLAPRLPEFESRMDPGFVACIRTGAALTMTEYQLIRDRKIAYIAAIHRWFEDWDFLVTPSVSVAAFPAERLMPEDWPEHTWDWLSWAEFSYPFNMSWNPAISVPCGWTADGRPVGMQIVGRRWDDAGVLRAASAFEAVAPWSARRPPVDD